MARRKTKMLILAALGGMLTTTFPANAEIHKVQLGIKVDKGNECPRLVTMMMWAHTGPYATAASFRVHGANGIPSQWKTADTILGPAGNKLATYIYKFNVTVNVDTKYRLEVFAHDGVAGSAWSNWVPLKVKCKPKKAIGSPNKSLSN